MIKCLVSKNWFFFYLLILMNYKFLIFILLLIFLIIFSYFTFKNKNVNIKEIEHFQTDYPFLEVYIFAVSPSRNYKVYYLIYLLVVTVF